MTDMETPELKPCPFCGGKNIELRDTSNHWQCFAAKIVCECAVSIEIPSNSFERAKEIAVTQWNTRVPQESQWEQMTEETTFEDGEKALLKFSSGEMMLYQWSEQRKIFYMNISGVQHVTRFDPELGTTFEFIRIPK